MKNDIDLIKERSYKPIQPRLDFLTEFIKSPHFKNDFRFEKRMTVSSENWQAEFIPWPVIDSFAIHNSLKELADEIREREGDAGQIYQLAERYFDKHEELKDFYTKFGYSDVSSLMFISGGAISECNPIIIETKPRVVLDLMSRK